MEREVVVRKEKGKIFFCDGLELFQTKPWLNLIYFQRRDSEITSLIDGKNLKIQSLIPVFWIVW